MAADDLDDAPHEPSLDDLIEVVRRFCERRNPFRSGPQLARDLPRLRHAMDLLELHFAKDAAAFSHTDEAELQGSSTPIDWIRHNCRMSGHAAADRVRVGRQLHRLPDSARATGEGRIGYAHLSLIASTARAITEPDPPGPSTSGRSWRAPWSRAWAASATSATTSATPRTRRDWPPSSGPPTRPAGSS